MDYTDLDRCRILVGVHRILMGIQRMIWIYDHTEVVTLIALIATPILMFTVIILIASGNTPEAEELEGFPDGTK